MDSQIINIGTGVREIGHPKGLNAYEFKRINLSQDLANMIPGLVDKMKVEPLPEKPKPNHLKLVT